MTSPEKKPNLGIIVPHTHFDREWYLPFQKFRFKLVQLIDELLEIVKNQNYYFMLDGQTIVIEDYLEIRPEKKDELYEQIRNGKVVIGPWYILPDEWLVGAESFIRNLEFSIDLAKSEDLPLMNYGYLPDQFGHTKAIPQILGDLTTINTAFIWRGVGEEIKHVLFEWRSSENSKTKIYGNYLPFGYGNFASAPETANELKEAIEEQIEALKPWNNSSTYLLMNGSDHLFPQGKVEELLGSIDVKDTEVEVGLIDHYWKAVEKEIEKKDLVQYSGEFRSSWRANLLQDTYSARMWIKQWNQKVEDLIINYAEPLQTFCWLNFGTEYPTSYLKLAWKWLLKNHPHDSICGCSVDQTHEEMKARFSWSESIAETMIEDAFTKIEEATKPSTEESVIVFNPVNSSSPNIFSYEVPANLPFTGLKDEEGKIYPIQAASSSQEIIYETTMGKFAIKTALKGLKGRQIFDFYINEVILVEGEKEGEFNIKILCDRQDTVESEIDIERTKNEIKKILDNKKYKKFNILITRQKQQQYYSIAPLKPLGITQFTLTHEKQNIDHEEIIISKDSVSNKYYDINFNKDGTFNLFDKSTDLQYSNLHKFEDWGDRGDEYTFGIVGPEKVEVKNIKRKLINKGPLIDTIIQEMELKLFKELDQSREKRIGERSIFVTSEFTFYNSIKRIDVKTTLKNTAKDHRLRICFDLPFKTPYTLTDTHFGYIKRKGSPLENRDYKEAPSGIQPQKRYIKVEDKEKNVKMSLFNKGLPEVELVDESKLALTLIRAVEWLSRSDIPARPEHAGPFLYTPGAQELDTEYTFEYAITTGKSEEAITSDMENSEKYTLSPIGKYLGKNISDSRNNQLFKIDNKWIRISSVRVKEDKMLITLFNMKDEKVETNITSDKRNINCSEVLINGEIKKELKVNDNMFNIFFNPQEIKLLSIKFV